jgi:gustatory receptor
MLILGIIFVISNKFKNLKTDFIRTESLSDTEKHTELKKLIQKHEAFIQIIAMIEKITAPVFLYTFMQSSFLMCFCGFQVLTGENFMKILYTTFFAVVLIRMLLICAGGQRIIDASESIADAVYKINWFEIKNLKIRKDLLLVMIQAQKGSKLTVGKFRTISLESFMTILSSALSYLTVLRTIWASNQG